MLIIPYMPFSISMCSKLLSHVMTTFYSVDILRLRQTGCHLAEDILKSTLLNENVAISPSFHTMVRRRIDAKSLPGRILARTHVAIWLLLSPILFQHMSEQTAIGNIKLRLHWHPAWSILSCCLRFMLARWKNYMSHTCKILPISISL